MAAINFGRIGILMGGSSTEREISLKSGEAVYESLKNEGLDALAIDIKTDDPQVNINKIISSRIDVAFIALHGRFGEDGGIQELLENLNIPYTGSGVMASRLALDKIASRKIFEVYGLYVPRYKVMHCLSFNRNFIFGNNLSFPIVVKPTSHGSSIGLSIIENEEGLNKAVEIAFSFDERIILEEYIKGREITVGILDDQPLPVIEIIPKNRFFDYEAKYNPGMTEYVVPANLDKVVAVRAQAAALFAHRCLGCYGFSRVDMILKDDLPFILEVNTIPGLTRMSLLPKAASDIGISFSQLCIKLVELAYQRAKTKKGLRTNFFKNYEGQKNKISV